MKSISNTAEDVTHIPTASRHNVTASATSGPNGNILGGGGDEAGKPHGFSKMLAQTRNKKGEELGWNAAIILRYLSYRVRKDGKDIDGKRWVRINLDHIVRRYPYMGRSTVDENVLRLKEFGLCEIDNLNSDFKRPKYDRTRCYHVPRKYMDATESEPRYFNPVIASQVGVPAAAIYFNFCHWCDEMEAQSAVKQWALRPSILKDLLPFSKSTIKRAIKKLVDEELIAPVPGTQCLYVPRNSGARGSNPDKGGSKADKGSSNSDESGSNPDNDIVNSNCSLLEECSKGKPTASSLKHPSGVEEAIDEPDYSSRVEIPHDAEGQQSDVIRHEETTSPGSENQFTPSTHHISGAASDVKGEWPHVSSLDQLHSINHISAPVGRIIEKQQACTSMLRDTVSGICAKVMASLTYSELEYLYNNENGDEIIRALLPRYHTFLDHAHLDRNGPLFPIIYYGALECMVGAFLWPRIAGDSYSHPISPLISVTHDLYLVLWGIAEERRLKDVDEEFAELRLIHASPDAHKENDADLAPAQKARIFRNALSSRNKVGWIFFDGTHRTEQITISRPGLNLIQKLFEHNEDASAVDLLNIMDRCIDAYINQPAPATTFRHGIMWNTRTGATDVLVFARNLKAIVRELDIHDCPIKTFLGEITKEQPQEEPMALAA